MAVVILLNPAMFANLRTGQAYLVRLRNARRRGIVADSTAAIAGPACCSAWRSRCKSAGLPLLHPGDLDATLARRCRRPRSTAFAIAIAHDGAVRRSRTMWTRYPRRPSASSSSGRRARRRRIKRRSACSGDCAWRTRGGIPTRPACAPVALRRCRVLLAGARRGDLAARAAQPGASVGRGRRFACRSCRCRSRPNRTSCCSRRRVALVPIGGLSLAAFRGAVSSCRSSYTAEVFTTGWSVLAGVPAALCRVVPLGDWRFAPCYDTRLPLTPAPCVQQGRSTLRDPGGPMRRFLCGCMLLVSRRSRLARASTAIAPTPIPPDLGEIKFTATGKLSPQFALVHLFAEKGFKGYALVDSAGRIAWHYRTRDYPFGAGRRKNGNFVFMDKGDGLVEVDRAGTIVHELKQRDAEHEMHHGDRRDAARHRAVSRVRYRGRSTASALKGEAIWEWTPGHRRGREALAIVGSLVARAGSLEAHRRRMAARQLARGRVARQHPRELSLHRPGDLDRARLEDRSSGGSAACAATIAVPADQQTSAQHTAAEIAPNRMLMFDNRTDLQPPLLARGRVRDRPAFAHGLRRGKRRECEAGLAMEGAEQQLRVGGQFGTPPVQRQHADRVRHGEGPQRLERPDRSVRSRRPTARSPGTSSSRA